MNSKEGRHPSDLENVREDNMHVLERPSIISSASWLRDFHGTRVLDP